MITFQKLFLCYNENMKILSPAGNYESLKAAVYNGCDEVYLGINNYNARNNIDGFDLKSLKQAVNFAHIFGVKVHLAINILFTDDEMQSAVNAIVDAYNLGVDAFIIQDLGLAYLIHLKYPDIEIHASTQMGIHNLEGVKVLEKFGFSRVVLARETPLQEIKRIKANSNIEIEYFVQGALCVSFSGNCYLSSYLCNASGNRGKCKQLCRLPYTLQQNGKNLKSGYLLSAKDFNLINKIESLKNAEVDAIKIEGRARRPYYVATATREYYNAINNLKINEDNLKLAFNRDYTAGYFEGNDKIISIYNNHIGIEIGKVEKVISGKTFNEVYFKSKVNLSPKSTFKIFYNSQEIGVLTAYDLKSVSKDTYRLTTTQKIKPNSTLNLIIDAKKEQEALSFTKRRYVDIALTCKTNQPIKAEVCINNQKIEIIGELCQQAKTQPLTQDTIKNNFNKSELFDAKINFIAFDSIFMPKQQLNEFRRSVFEKVECFLTTTTRNIKKFDVKKDYSAISFKNFEIIENCHENFLQKNIIYSPEIYSFKDVQQFIKKCKQQNKKPYLDLPNFALEKDIELLKNIVLETKIGIVANNYYALDFKTNDIIIGGGLNVYNSFTAKIFNKPIICAESNIATNIKYPYMTLRHCPMKNHLKANCNNCPYNNNYTYKMDNGKVLKLKRKKISTCTFYLCD